MCLKVHISNYSLYSLGFIAVYFFMFFVLTYRNETPFLNVENKSYFQILKNDQLIIKHHLFNNLPYVYYLDILNIINIFLLVSCFFLGYDIDLSFIYIIYIILGIPVLLYRLLIIACFS